MKRGMKKIDRRLFIGVLLIIIILIVLMISSGKFKDVFNTRKLKGELGTIGFGSGGFGVVSREVECGLEDFGDSREFSDFSEDDSYASVQLTTSFSSSLDENELLIITEELPRGAEFDSASITPDYILGDDQKILVWVLAENPPTYYGDKTIGNEIPNSITYIIEISDVSSSDDSSNDDSSNDDSSNDDSSNDDSSNDDSSNHVSSNDDSSNHVSNTFKGKWGLFLDYTEDTIMGEDELTSC